MWRPENWKEMMIEKYGEPCLDWQDGCDTGADAMLEAVLKHFKDNMQVKMIDFLYAHGDVERFKKEVESLFTGL